MLVVLILFQRSDEFEAVVGEALPAADLLTLPPKVVLVRALVLRQLGLFPPAILRGQEGRAWRRP